MNADAIVKRIMDDAQEDARRTAAQADEKIQLMAAQREQRLQAAREQARADAEKEGRELRDRMLRVAELDERKELLAAKREIIDQAFQLALEKLNAMNASQARDYLFQLFMGAAEGGEEIVVNEKDVPLYDAAFLKRLNDALKARGAGEQVKLSDERRALAGGFVLKKGGVEINCSYAAVLGEMRARLEAEVAALLF